MTQFISDHPQDHSKQISDERLSDFLDCYDVEDMSPDLSARIKDEAEFYASQKQEASFLSKIAHGFVYVVFSGSYRPVAIAVVMVLALTLSMMHDATRLKPAQDHMNDYASIMMNNDGILDNRSIRNNEDDNIYTADFSLETGDLMMQDFEQHFDI